MLAPFKASNTQDSERLCRRSNGTYVPNVSTLNGSLIVSNILPQRNDGPYTPLNHNALAGGSQGCPTSSQTFSPSASMTVAAMPSGFTRTVLSTIAFLVSYIFLRTHL